MRPPYMEKNQAKADAAGEILRLNHGYDTSVSIYDLDAEAIEKAAQFRGGHFLGPGQSVGIPGTVFEWECEHGHRFRASLEYVLLGGGWCLDCDQTNIRRTVTAKNRFISQVLSSQYLE